MTINPRFYRLTLLHRQLDDALRRESRGGSPFRLLRLKALKLAVRARLAGLSRQPAFAL